MNVMSLSNLPLNLNSEVKILYPVIKPDLHLLNNLAPFSHNE